MTAFHTNHENILVRPHNGAQPITETTRRGVETAVDAESKPSPVLSPSSLAPHHREAKVASVAERDAKVASVNVAFRRELVGFGQKEVCHPRGWDDATKVPARPAEKEQL